MVLRFGLSVAGSYALFQAFDIQVPFAELLALSALAVLASLAPVTINGVGITEGVFVLAPSPFTVTFVGEVPQGSLKNPIPAGFSIKSSQVPQAGTAADLGFVGNPNDTLYQFNTNTQTYDVSTFDEFDLVWYPNDPVMNVGEAFFSKKTASADWVRNFTVP